jgi:hypothetical protein
MLMPPLRVVAQLPLCGELQGITDGSTQAMIEQVILNKHELYWYTDGTPVGTVSM